MGDAIVFVTVIGVVIASYATAVISQIKNEIISFHFLNF